MLCFKFQSLKCLCFLNPTSYYVIYIYASNCNGCYDPVWSRGVTQRTATMYNNKAQTLVGTLMDCTDMQ